MIRRLPEDRRAYGWAIFGRICIASVVALVLWVLVRLLLLAFGWNEPNEVFFAGVLLGQAVFAPLFRWAWP